MRRIKPKIIVILGPTASGKSTLGVKLARRFNGEIVSADSRQVYRGLDIGSGKVSRDKNPKSYILSANWRTKFLHKGIPHHLLDVASPRSIFTVVQYQKRAGAAIKKILKKGKVPIIVGGTGFYIDALLYGYQLPAIKPHSKFRKALETLSTQKLFSELRLFDPARASTIDRHNRRRLIRALEIVLETGRPVPSLIRANRRMVNFDVLKIGFRLPGEELKNRIKKRTERRLKRGMIQEVANLHNPPAGRGVSWNRLDSFGLGYRWTSRYLRGLITKKALRDTLQKEEWRYAKRQMTWFKRDNTIRWLQKEKDIFRAVKKFLYN